jgi:hypothetical protein
MLHLLSIATITLEEFGFEVHMFVSHVCHNIARMITQSLILSRLFIHLFACTQNL